ncbi:MAG TPA: phosphatidate cytidylyltransferase [Candidatus Binatia bacterium]|nr:phosphatidate cytidylyltransferase [Candidatus Binatia bacterium]
MNEAAPIPAPASSSKLKTFLRRLLSTVILWTVLLGAMFSGNVVLSNTVFLVIMCTLTVVGLLEFYGLAARIGLFCFKVFGIIGGLLLIVGTFLHFSGKLGISGTPARVNDSEISFIILFVLGLCVRQFLSKSNTTGIAAISTTLFGLMYVPWLLNFIQKINYFPGVNGVYYVLYFILVTKFSDTGAYVTGSLIGKTKMIPRISPGKTWEGFGGAILFSVGASVAFAHLARSKVPEFKLPHAVILGLVLACTAVVGDLIESLFKREAGVKDSGNFFPGIGGILDLLDSLLFNAPLMYLYLRHVITNPTLNA